MYKQKGVDTDLELALFNADHNRQLEESLDNTQKAFDEGSKSIKVFHSLAWLNFKMGNYDEAQKNIEQALRLGTKDPLMYYHAAGYMKRQVSRKNQKNIWSLL
jgi:tetratricopeptide (TPR) repeat protein